jgi:hypothetical protein
MNGRRTRHGGRCPWMRVKRTWQRVHTEEGAHEGSVCIQKSAQEIVCNQFLGVTMSVEFGPFKLSQ